MSKENLQGAVAAVAMRLRRFQNGPDAIHAAKSAPIWVRSTIESYNVLISMIPGLTPEQLSIMPSTRVFLEKMGGRSLPTLTDMARDPKWNVHCQNAQDDLVGMMWKAEANEFYGAHYDKDDTIYFGAKVKSPIAFIIGTVGHMAERMTFRAVDSASEPWEKDDLMHTFNELAMLKALTDPKNSNLLMHFAATRDKGGMEWVSFEHWVDFKQNHAALQQNNPPCS